MTGQVVRLRRAPPERRSDDEGRGRASPPDTREILATVIERLARSALADRDDWRDTSPWGRDGSSGLGWDPEGSTITDLDLDEHLDELLEAVEPEELRLHSHPHLTHDLVLVQAEFDSKVARAAADPRIPPPLPVKRTHDPVAASGSPHHPPHRSSSSLLTPGALLEGRSIREMVSSDRIERSASSAPSASRSRALTSADLKLFVAVLLLAIGTTVCTSTVLEEWGRLRVALADLLGAVLGG